MKDDADDSTGSIPSSSKTRTESQSISLSTGPCCVSSQKAQTYFFVNYSWFIVCVVLLRVQTWSVRFRRFTFHLSLEKDQQLTLAAQSARKDISPRIFGFISSSQNLDFRLIPLPIFAQFLCFPFSELYLPRRTIESWLFLRHLYNIR